MDPSEEGEMSLFTASQARSWMLVWLLHLVMTTVSAAPLVDPTRPAGWTRSAAAVEQTPLPQFTVSLVKLSSSLRMAVVNGHSVREGDEVDGARVVAIRREGVELEHGSTRLRLATPGASATLGVIRVDQREP